MRRSVRLDVMPHHRERSRRLDTDTKDLGRRRRKGSRIAVAWSAGVPTGMTHERRIVFEEQVQTAKKLQVRVRELLAENFERIAQASCPQVTTNGGKPPVCKKLLGLAACKEIHQINLVIAGEEREAVAPRRLLG